MRGRKIEETVRKYADLVYRVAFSILKNKEDSEDVFQDIFVKLCSSNIKFLNEEHEKAWLIRATRNQCLDFLKRSCNKKRADLDENLRADGSESEPENNSYILEEVMKLPEKYRTVLYLFYYEGYKISEISKILEINESTLKSQLVKARELLKESIKEEF